MVFSTREHATSDRHAPRAVVEQCGDRGRCVAVVTWTRTARQSTVVDRSRVRGVRWARGDHAGIDRHELPAARTRRRVDVLVLSRGARVIDPRRRCTRRTRSRRSSIARADTAAQGRRSARTQARTPPRESRSADLFSATLSRSRSELSERLRSRSRSRSRPLSRLQAESETTAASIINVRISTPLLRARSEALPGAEVNPPEANALALARPKRP